MPPRQIRPPRVHVPRAERAELQQTQKCVPDGQIRRNSRRWRTLAKRATAQELRMDVPDGP